MVCILVLVIHYAVDFKVKLLMNMFNGRLQPFLYSVFMWCLDSIGTLRHICIHICACPIVIGVSHIYHFFIDLDVHIFAILFLTV